MMIERCAEADLPEVFDLYRRTLRFPPAEHVAEFWAWKVRGNPCRNRNEPPFWVAREGRALVGGMAEIPVVLDLDGRAVPAAWAADFMIEPRAQGRGLGKALFDHFRRSNEVAISMGNPPGSRTSHVSRAVGFVGCPPLVYMFRLLTTKAVTRRLPLGRRLDSAVARLSRAPLRRLDRLHRPAPTSLRIAEVAAFDPAFDALWKTVASEAVVSVRRDHATMNWRYRDAPFARYRTLGAWAGDALAGCVVFKVARHDAFSYATIAELVAPAQAVDVQEALLASALDALERDGVDIVKTLASPPHLVRALGRAGFRALGQHSDFVIAVAPPLRAAFAGHLDPHAWYLTKGDCDLDMVPDFMSRLSP